MKPAPQCAPQSKDAETCKKSKSDIFAVTGFLHPTDDMYSHCADEIYGDEAMLVVCNRVVLKRTPTAGTVGGMDGKYDATRK